MVSGSRLGSLLKNIESLQPENPIPVSSPIICKTFFAELIYNLLKT
jgi:hypothetical protein